MSAVRSTRRRGATPVTIDELNVALLVGAGVLLVAILAVRLSSRAGLPSLLLYLGIGAVLSWSGLEFNELEVAQAVGIAALVIILAEGGITTRWETIRPQLPLALSLATVGVGVSVAVVAVVAHYVLDFPWQLAVLCGAILSSTDAAAIFSTLRRVPLKSRVAGHAGGRVRDQRRPGDHPGAAGERARRWHDAARRVRAARIRARRRCGHRWPGRLGRRGDAPSGRASGVRALPDRGHDLHGARVRRGCLSARQRIPGGLSGRAGARQQRTAAPGGDPEASSRRSRGSRRSGCSSCSACSSCRSTTSPGRALFRPALVIGVVLTFVARPLSVLIATTAFRVPWREQAFLSWAGLRGAVPIVIAILPAVADVDGSRDLLDIVFVLVVLFTIVQSPTLPWMARRLGSPRRPRPASSPSRRRRWIASAPSCCSSGSRSDRGCTASRWLSCGFRPGRWSRSWSATTSRSCPSPTTGLRVGDEVLVVVPSHSRAEVERRLAAVSEHGRLAGWLAPTARPERADGTVSSAAWRWGQVSRWPGRRARRTPRR